MDSYVSKPITSAALQEVVHRHLMPTLPTGDASARPMASSAPSTDSGAVEAGAVAFDPSALQALPMVMDGSRPGFAEEMRALFASTGAADLMSIDAALAQVDDVLLRRLMHTHKSSGAQVTTHRAIGHANCTMRGAGWMWGCRSSQESLCGVRRLATPDCHTTGSRCQLVGLLGIVRTLPPRAGQLFHR